MEQDSLTHLNQQGRARMVDVTAKAITHRTATAMSTVRMAPETLTRIRSGGVQKGDVLAVAQVAGILAAKRTWELIPLCHPLPLTAVDIQFLLRDTPCQAEILATASCQGSTGVEMEALTAASTAALTVYDMCKAIQRDMVIDDVRLLHKTGGRSGDFYAPGVGQVVSVNVSEHRGEQKHPVAEIQLRPGHGILGDAHAGNWHRQVSLLAQERVDTMRTASPLPLPPGVFAENVTTRGLDWKSLPIGTRFYMGEAALELTQIGKSCHNDCAIRQAAGTCVMPTDGVFAAVLQPGTVRPGSWILPVP